MIELLLERFNRVDEISSSDFIVEFKVDLLQRCDCFLKIDEQSTNVDSIKGRNLNPVLSPKRTIPEPEQGYWVDSAIDDLFLPSRGCKEV